MTWERCFAAAERYDVTGGDVVDALAALRSGDPADGGPARRDRSDESAGED